MITLAVGVYGGVTGTPGGVPGGIGQGCLREGARLRPVSANATRQHIARACSGKSGIA